MNKKRYIPKRKQLYSPEGVRLVNILQEQREKRLGHRVEQAVNEWKEIQEKDNESLHMRT